jgi:phosphotransferase system HPr-like phosphotransfer protein
LRQLRKGVILMTFNIKIQNAQDAQNLNKIAEKYPFDIWVHGKSGYADAKSLLGLMLLTIEQDVKLVVDDDIDVELFKKDICQYFCEDYCEE